ncbi:MAG: YihY/virulence factor BrkB family protein [Kaiparowitsia implicata GSE-PSE-MK54-09C]|jgi:membrane protein|nr:YihY/virulence factor BrkB family protein [Kaiparowitsia implicata GSE-PSE-MK54-09C]
MRYWRFWHFWLNITPRTLGKTIQRAGQYRLPGLAAEMAYNTMLALFPAILAMITAIGIFQPLQRTFQGLVGNVSEVVPLQAMALIQEFADEISTSRDTGLFSVSFAIAIWASSGALSAAMNALDQIHQIPPNLRRPFWKAKLISLLLTVGTLLLLLVAIFLVFVSDLIIRNVAGQSDALQHWVLTGWRLLSFPLSLGIMALAFGFIYRFGCSRWEKGWPLMPGAIVAAVFWAIASNGFRVYVANFADYNRTYGAVGAVIVLMLWLYLTSLVLLFASALNVSVGESMMAKASDRALRDNAQPQP